MTPTPVARTFSILPDAFAVCRLAPDAAIPDWAMPRHASFFAITQTREELSVICPAEPVPADITADRGWRCLKLEGPFALDEPGILAAIVVPLAQAGLTVFVEATYDTDYLLVKDMGKAVQTLKGLGHRVLE